MNTQIFQLHYFLNTIGPTDVTPRCHDSFPTNYTKQVTLINTGVAVECFTEPSDTLRGQDDHFIPI
jgi:hypothetical protein